MLRCHENLRLLITRGKNCSNISNILNGIFLLQIIYKMIEEEFEKKLQITEENHSIWQESPILKLNNDCLINIFKFLTIRDRLIAERGKFTDKKYTQFAIQSKIEHVRY